MQEKSAEEYHIIANFLWCIKLGIMQKLVQYFLYLLLNAIFICRGYSSVVEHPAAIRQVLGSNPSVPYFSKKYLKFNYFFHRLEYFQYCIYYFITRMSSAHRKTLMKTLIVLFSGNITSAIYCKLLAILLANCLLFKALLLILLSILRFNFFPTYILLLHFFQAFLHF